MVSYPFLHFSVTLSKLTVFAWFWLWHGKQTVRGFFFLLDHCVLCSYALSCIHHSFTLFNNYVDVYSYNSTLGLVTPSRSVELLLSTSSVCRGHTIHFHCVFAVFLLLYYFMFSRSTLSHSVPKISTPVNILRGEINLGVVPKRTILCYMHIYVVFLLLSLFFFRMLVSSGNMDTSHI